MDEQKGLLLIDMSSVGGELTETLRCEKRGAGVPQVLSKRISKHKGFALSITHMWYDAQPRGCLQDETIDGRLLGVDKKVVTGCGLYACHRTLNTFLSLGYLCLFLF
ncbi:hypothetical protein CC1G_14850 [Coprinopsis cinerea okayama7|uniref:Uncharacterized protein n=1 Tax=Coprinopsis cinerea (strain Okayama-7 / 130 / ATCC MYA-4618 / FGSC 9003) TaxID=240176 RepID=D6RNR1_COPC7|nr:hypothetical protein CC1G_14850 [Coprinopsis cinerea okayama7\|eukprot:XP_002910873.1 hypothetical protein CC1G_14850 [Coprinopsis cinerea okayama7\